MKKRFPLIVLTLGFLLLGDLVVALGQQVLIRTGKAEGLVRYLEYGLSVPGKIELMKTAPARAGDLYNVSWLPAEVAASAEAAAAAPADQGPVMRVYGMSFANRMARAAAAQDPSISLDLLSGPAAPPNFAYAAFVADRPNRKAGDVVVLGVLSESIQGMASFSNRSWMFEQPSPMTYPIYRLSEEGELRALAPIVKTVADQDALASDRDLRRAWHRQLAREDLFYNSVVGGAPWLDASPLARFVRRYLVKYHLNTTKAKMLAGDGPYPWEDVLQEIVREFGRTARADGQIPVVALMETARQPLALGEVLQPVIAAERIGVVDAGAMIDLREPGNFLPDGHYVPAVDDMLGRRLIEVIEDQRR